MTPRLSVVTPTFNNLDVLKQCLDGWQRFGGSDFEIIVVEDGCRDATPDFLRDVERTAWGQKHLRWIHMDDAHELRCTNAGFAMARGEFVMAWQDDMFLRAPWLVDELCRTFDAYADIGMIALSRGLDCLPLDQPIETYEDLVDGRRLPSTIGPAPWNWLRLQEVDVVIRPWVVRRACLDRVGTLDEAFRPTEWDEADLAFRLRAAGWRVATFGYERVGAYVHLGSTTLNHSRSATYIARVLENGRLFHSRWDATIAAQHPRPRRTWMRRTAPAAWLWTSRRMLAQALRRGRPQA